MKTKWIITVKHATESYDSHLSDASKNVKNDMEMENIERNYSISYCNIDQKTEIIVKTEWIITARHSNKSYDSQLSDTFKKDKNDKEMENIECNYFISYCNIHQENEIIVKYKWIITVRHAAESHNSQLSDAFKNVKNDKEMENIEHSYSISYCNVHQKSE
jgi:uncharacterized protein YlbG (UPF0298 family)